MIKYSFVGTYSKNTKEETHKFMEQTDKPFVYTMGLSYRHPTTYRVPVTREQALDNFDNHDWVDVTEEETCVHVNAYSGNDME